MNTVKSGACLKRDHSVTQAHKHGDASRLHNQQSANGASKALSADKSGHVGKNNRIDAFNQGGSGTKHQPLNGDTQHGTDVRQANMNGTDMHGMPDTADVVRDQGLAPATMGGPGALAMGGGVPATAAAAATAAKPAEAKAAAAHNSRIAELNPPNSEHGRDDGHKYAKPPAGDVTAADSDLLVGVASTSDASDNGTQQHMQSGAHVKGIQGRSATSPALSSIRSLSMHGSTLWNRRNDEWRRAYELLHEGLTWQVGMYAVSCTCMHTATLDNTDRILQMMCGQV